MARRRIDLTVLWGNGDAESTLTILWSQWLAICCGEDFVGESEGRYEGQSFTTFWSFEDRHVSVCNDDGGSAFRGELESLAAVDRTTGECLPVHSREAAQRARVRRRRAD